MENKQSIKESRYVAGWNMPGYMPDHAEEFENLESALSYIREELRRYGEEIDESDFSIENAQKAISDKESVWLGKYVFFVNAI